MAAVDFPGPALADRAEKLWTKDDYFAASAAGLLERCELIDGRIYSRVNAGASHNAIVSKLTWALGDVFERELVWIEKEVEFPGEFHPQPDVTLLSRRVVDRNPRWEEVAAIVEVADRTVYSDVAVKLPKDCRRTGGLGTRHQSARTTRPDRLWSTPSASRHRACRCR